MLPVVKLLYYCRSFVPPDQRQFGGTFNAVRRDYSLLTKFARRTTDPVRGGHRIDCTPLSLSSITMVTMGT